MKRKGISRRKFIAGGAKALTAAMALGGLGYFLNYEVSYARWYEKNIKNARRKKDIHTDLLKESELSEEWKRILMEKLNDEMKDEILESKFYKGISFDLFDVEERIFKKYVSKNRKAINEFFSYAGLEDRIKNLDIKFEKLKKEKKLENPQDNKITFYVALQLFDCVVGRYFLDVNGRKGRADVISEESFAGEFNTGSNFYFSNHGIKLKFQDTSPIVISAGIDAIRSYTTPSAEMLHYFLRKTTAKSIEREINKKWESLGKLRGLAISSIEEIMEEAVKREEGIVHGAINSFVEENGKRMGLTENELKKYLSSYQESRYMHIPFVMDLIKKKGCKEVVRNYLEEPRIIFKD